MNKIRKTYAVTGLMEWQCRISNGKAHLNILFTGGTLTGFGQTPALYTTDNPIFQRIIEGSGYFKNGRITLYRETDLEEEDPCYQLGAIGEKPEVVEENGHKETPVVTGGENSETPSEGNSETVEVSSLDDAKEYLIGHLGMKSSELRSKKAILEAAAAAGIAFKGDI
ncbi:hypothetical protein [Segatella buccae]